MREHRIAYSEVKDFVKQKLLPDAEHVHEGNIYIFLI